MTTLAINGGSPVRTKVFAEWPVVTDDDKAAIQRVLDSRKWGRHLGNEVLEFEEAFADWHGMNDCVTVTNGTAALEIALRAGDVGLGDEVLVPPYTFFATVSSVLMVGALPVFVDIDPETYCIDPEKATQAISPNTKAIIPVHIAGGVSHMDKVNALAGQHNLLVIEDACQAHLAEWKGQKVGTLGDLGCFSFQASKNLNSGEGGAILGKNVELLERCYSIHTCGRERDEIWYQHPYLGTNARMTEFQAALLKSQMQHTKSQTHTREENAAYLDEQISHIPGIKPLGQYPEVTRHAYHIYILQYNSGQFDGLARDTFIKALQQEGIPCHSGYVPLHKEKFIEDATQSSTFRSGYDNERLEHLLSEVVCPTTEKACREESIWLGQNLLLGTTEDMDDIAEAIRKIADNYKELLS